MLLAFARLVRERPAGSASVLLACTVDEEYTHIGSSRLAETPHGAELADRSRTDGARPGALPQRRHALENPDARNCLSQLDARGRSQRHLPDGEGAGCARDACAVAGPFEARPDSRPADACPSEESRGAERQHRSRLVRDRGRSPADTGRGRKRLREPGPDQLEQSLGAADWIEFDEPSVHMPPLAPRARRGSISCATPFAAATGRRPEVLGVPFGTDAGP